MTFNVMKLLCEIYLPLQLCPLYCRIIQKSWRNREPGWRRNTQFQHNDIQYSSKKMRHHDIQHNNIGLTTLSITTLSTKGL